MSDAINPFANVKIAVTPKEGQGAQPSDTVNPFTQAEDTPVKAAPPEAAPSKPKQVTPDMREKIKEAAIEEGYRSDSRGKKETTKTFAYTFYPSDIKSIRRIKMAVMDEHIDINISDSEVMRAAIAALKELPYEEQKRLLLDQKNR